jgi:hypothetical protein
VLVSGQCSKKTRNKYRKDEDVLVKMENKFVFKIVLE